MVRFPLLFLILLTAFGFPRGAGAQAVFEFEPDTVVANGDNEGMSVVRNTGPEAILLDSLSMLWDPIETERHLGAFVTGQPVEFLVEFVFIRNDSTSFTIGPDSLVFAPGDSLLMEFHIPCIVFANNLTGVLKDTLLFHSEGLAATDSLFIRGFPPYCEISNEDNPNKDQEGLQLTIHPNPSADLVAVELSLDRPEDVSVAVYDVRGRQISVLNRGSMPPGEYTFTWGGSDVAPGVYTIRAITDEASMTRSVTITH